MYCAFLVASSSAEWLPEHSRWYKRNMKAMCSDPTALCSHDTITELLFTLVDIEEVILCKSICKYVSIIYLYFQARTASERVEQIRTSVLVTLEEKIQTVFDTVLGSQGLQIKLAALERTVRNGTAAGIVS
jgi:hypothetical protein